MRGISQLVEELLASHEEICSVELTENHQDAKFNERGSSEMLLPEWLVSDEALLNKKLYCSCVLRIGFVNDPVSTAGCGIKWEDGFEA